MKVEYKLKDKFDFGLFIPAVLLAIMGLVAIYSSTHDHPFASGNFQKQLVFLVVSIFMFFIIYFIPAQTFKSFSIFSYLGSLALLLAVLVIGKKVYGARSWMDLGPVGFQPSEFAKIGTIFLMAYFLSGEGRSLKNIKDLLITLAIGGVPVLFILMQPDMGTAIVFLFITLVILFWSGVDLFALFVVLSPGLAVFASLFGTIQFLIALVVIIGILFIFKKDLLVSGSVFVLNVASGLAFDLMISLLKPHQQKRIAAFLDPSADPRGGGYNVSQAMVAIGAGGFLGKGFMQGSQTQLRFIPEQWTDFIFCVIGEEFGFVGSVLVVVLFGIIFLRLLNIAQKAKDTFGSVTIMGILALFFVHFCINIGMNIGLTPVIGLPLPFVSYGGSSLVVNMAMLGVAANIYRNRKHRE